MIAWHGNNQRFLHDNLIGNAWHIGLRAHKGHIELAPQKGLRQVQRILARDGDLDLRQLIVKDSHGFWKPLHLLTR
jgi:hypothetical protein